MAENEFDWYSILSGFGSKSMDEIGFYSFMGIMGISLLSSFLIALLYIRFYKPRSTGSMIYRAFPLLGISITAIFIAIQFSLPLSLGLLGALSIVRFRTPIKEPEEIGFIMLIVATSLCCATFNILFLLIIIAAAVIALFGLHFGRSFLVTTSNDGVLIIEVPVSIYKQTSTKILELLKERVTNGRLDSLSESGDKTVITFNFRKFSENLLLSVEDEIHGLHPDIKMSAYYNNNQSI